MTAPETPNTVHGRLLEAVHISGYTFERACSEFKWLLEEDRWKTIGGGYQDINAFVATIDFSEFRIAVDQRKEIAKLLKSIEASQRATAKMLGVSKDTIRLDLKSGENSPPAPEPQAESPKEEAASGENSPPAWFQDDIDPAELAKSKSRSKGKLQKQEERTQSVAFNAAALGKFAVLYADPPWRYENPPMGGSNRSIENHYPTMTLEEICALPVEDIAHDNSILFLWATAPKLAECFDVITAWGFTYRTNMVWVKDQIGMGYHARNRHELLLIAKRGELPPPDTGNRPDSVFEAPRTEHSAKPREYYSLINSMYPTLPKIELFCRGGAPSGWQVWGNEAEAA